MKNLKTLRSFIFYSITLSIISIIFVLVVWYIHRDLFNFKSWSEYLNKNEKAGISRHDFSESRNTADSLFKIPGYNTTVLGSNKYNETNCVIVYAKPKISTSSASLSDIYNYWTGMGIETEKLQDMVLSISGREKVYMATNSGKEGVFLCKFQNYSFSNESSGNEQKSSILPSPPSEIIQAQAGERGRSGYTVLVNLGADASHCFREITKDLLKRGWEKFSMDNTRINVSEYSFSETFRHRDKPLGCLLMVREKPDYHNRSQAFVCLF